jgi:uncharacterized iron-regulated membrane protein
VVLVTAISGLLLAHAGSIEPPVRGASVQDAAPINDLLIASLRAVLDRDVRVFSPEGELRPARGPAAIERARFTPATATVAVRLRDALPLDIVLDWKTAQVLSVTPSHAHRWAQLHSGAALGSRGLLLSDATAGAIVLLALTGVWLWFRGRAQADLSRATRLHRRLGLVAGLVLLVPAVTGVLLNHRADLGFTYRPHRELDGEQISKMTPAQLSTLMDAANSALASSRSGSVVPVIEWLDYFPRNGLVTIAFRDGTDVFLDAYSGELRAVHPPRDTWVRQLHSGRIFGAAGWVLTDLIALLWIAVTGGGLYLAIRSRRGEASA